GISDDTDFIERQTRVNRNQQAKFRQEVAGMLRENDQLIRKLRAQKAELSQAAPKQGGFIESLFGSGGIMRFIGMSIAISAAHTIIYGLINSVQSLIAGFGQLMVSAVGVGAAFE